MSTSALRPLSVRPLSNEQRFGSFWFWLRQVRFWKSGIGWTGHLVSCSRLVLVLSLLFGLSLLMGCITSLQTLVQEEGESALVNYALASYGTHVVVSQDNPGHPASTLINGITSSEAWDQGEGWEVNYDGPYAYGRYFAYGSNTAAATSAALARERYARLNGQQVEPQSLNPQDFEEKDDNWRGLRGNDSYSGGVQSAFGWVVLEFPHEVQINKVLLYTVDSPQYPAANFGVNHVRVQYWIKSSIAAGWANINRYNKKVGQKDDSISNIKIGRVIFRFRPVKTTKIRVAVLWTNDAERTRTYGRRHYSKGTVRLVEVEAYGLEKALDATADAGSSTEEEVELLLDRILTGDTAKSQTTGDVSPGAEARVPAPLQQPGSLKVVRAYVDAYAHRDVEALMTTVSPNYAQDGETRDGLRTRMGRLFEAHSGLLFEVGDIKTRDEGHTVEAHYSLRLSGDATPLTGTLRFGLEQTDGTWKIREIEPVP